jgi:hypothetical protein
MATSDTSSVGTQPGGTSTADWNRFVARRRSQWTQIDRDEGLLTQNGQIEVMAARFQLIGESSS